MFAQVQVTLRAVSFLLVCLFPSLAHATSWKTRTDVGVAAVDMRTGKVLWEAWQSDEVPDGVSKEAKAAVKSLLPRTKEDRGSDPSVRWLPTAPATDLVIENPWPEGKYASDPSLSLGKTLTYYRHGNGVIALGRKTKEEVWRLLTMLHPFPSEVLEADGLVLIQIGSHVPQTIKAVLIGGDEALPKLGPRTAKQRVAAAMLLRHYGDGYLRPELRKHLEQYRKTDNDPDAKAATKAIEKLLVSWPRKRDGQRLLDGCVAALLKPDENVPLQEFAWRGTQRVLAWCLLQELIYGSPPDGYDRPGRNYAYSSWNEKLLSLTNEVKAKLVEHCRQIIAKGPEEEKPFAASALVSTAIGWAELKDAERKKLLLSSQPSVWRWTAMSLVKNNRREQLIKWAAERPASDHLDVVWILTHKKPKEWSAAELDFWRACARRTPGSIAYVLDLKCEGEIPLVFRAPIRSDRVPHGWAAIPKDSKETNSVWVVRVRLEKR